MVRRTRDTATLAGIIYFVQGFLGISGIALPLYLRSLEWSVSEITMMSSLASLPWIFKFFFGFLSDTYPIFGHRRKSHLILFALTGGLGWFLLTVLPPEKHFILMAMMLSNLGFAATDVITDALVVEHSAGAASQIYQAIAWGARSFGAVMSGVLSGWLAARFHPYQVFGFTMTLSLVIVICAMLVHERNYDEVPLKPVRSPLSKCIQTLFGPQLKYFTCILFLVSISSSFAVPFFFYMRETLLFPETFLGLLTSLGWGGAMLGSFIYMRWLRHLPAKKVLRWAIVLNSLNIFGTLLISDQNTALGLVFIGGVMACLVMLPIVSAAAALVHQTGLEGTLFAVLMSVFNIGQILFGFTGGKIYGVIGLSPLIIASGVGALLGLFFIRKLQMDPHVHPKL